MNRYSRLSILLLAAYWPLLLFVFHVPIEHRPSTGIIPPDKTVHFIAYGLFGFLAAWVAWPRGVEGESRGWSWLVQRGAIVLVLLVVHGCLDEWTQPLTGRTCDWRDLRADAIGATLGIVTFTLLAMQPRLARFAQW